MFRVQPLGDVDRASDIGQKTLAIAIVVAAELRPEISPSRHARDEHAHRHAPLLQCARHRILVGDRTAGRLIIFPRGEALIGGKGDLFEAPAAAFEAAFVRSEEHTSELQSLMRISYAVFCLKKKKSSK